MRKEKGNETPKRSKASTGELDRISGRSQASFPVLSGTSSARESPHASFLHPERHLQPAPS